VPDLRGRIPIHQGNGFILAETGGAEEITLTVQQIPSHSHPFLTNAGAGSSSSPGNNVLATAVGNLYFPPPSGNAVIMAANMIGPTGGSQPHNNMQPYLCVSFIISLFGIFPSPT
jgi:microcystin-dependent protein